MKWFNEETIHNSCGGFFINLMIPASQFPVMNQIGEKDMSKLFGSYLAPWSEKYSKTDSRGNIYKSRLILVLLLFFGFMFSNAYAVSMNYLGAWNSTSIYAAGSVISFNNASYYSLKSSYSAPNKNKIPSTQPLWWRMIGGDTTALANKVKDLETKSAALTAKISALESKDAALTNLINNLTAKDAALTNLINNLTAKDAALTSLINNLTAKDAALTSSIENLTGKVSGLESKNAALTSKIQNMEADIIPDLGDVLEYDVDNNTVLFTGVNVQIVNGLGDTRNVNGTGNLIVGYNELWNYRFYCSDGQYTNENDCVSPNVWGANQRLGSHNIITGAGNDYTQYGSILGGFRNVSNGQMNILGGESNIASGWVSNVVGGNNNETLGASATIVGGSTNKAIGNESSVLGGRFNNATGDLSTISGGDENISSGWGSSVSGGWRNNSSGEVSSISGGSHIIMSTDYGWAAGNLREE